MNHTTMDSAAPQEQAYEDPRQRLLREKADLLVRQTRSLLFTNIYLTVGEEKILRASAIAKIPSGDGPAFSRARLDRSAEMASKSPST